MSMRRLSLSAPLDVPRWPLCAVTRSVQPDAVPEIFRRRAAIASQKLKPWTVSISDKPPWDEVAARQFGADRACYALRDALVCRVGQGMERGAQPHVIIDG